MKCRKLVFVLLVGFNNNLQAQLKIGNNPMTLDASAAFEMESSSKGFLPPRLTTAQRDAIVSPTPGLTIYNTSKGCPEVFNGTGWWNKCDRSLSAPGGGGASSGGTAIVSAWSSSVGCNMGAGTNNSPAGVRQGGVNETMVQGVAAPATATITLVATVTTAGTYNVFTNTVNGVSFAASGTFASTGSQTVTLTPTGTPTLAGNYMWTTNRTPSMNVYGSVLTTSAPLGSSYNAHFNGCDSAGNTLHSIAQPFTAASYTGGDVFSNNTTCQNKPVSAQGCGGVTSVTTSSGRVHTAININGQCWLQTNLIEVPGLYNTYTTISWTNTAPGDQGYWGYYNTSTIDGSAGWGATEPAVNEGRLYQWCGATNSTISERTRGICPAGWHVPSDCEWMFLEHGQGMSITQQNLSAWRANTADNEGTPGYKLRSQGAGQTNASGFTGVFAGLRNPANGSFYSYGSHGGLWSSTTSGTSGRTRGVYQNFRGVIRALDNKAQAFSVRCLKD
jgi:uncharacterized protein (TIGR02145 family)